MICARAPDAYSAKPHTALYFPGAPKELHNAGRLDGDSEGLLIMTTDGHLSHFVTRPGGAKEYLALVGCWDGRPPGAECLEALRQGVELSDGPAAARAVELVDFDGRYGRLRIVVASGRFRMVRRMLRHVGYGCLQLLRLSACGVGGLAPPAPPGGGGAALPAEAGGGGEARHLGFGGPAAGRLQHPGAPGGAKDLRRGAGKGARGACGACERPGEVLAPRA